MKSVFEVWRRHLWLWCLPLGFCVLNLLGIAVYNWAFAGKVERLDAQYQGKIAYRDQLREEREVVARFLESMSSHQERARGLYAEQFQTEAQRFTRVIQDVKELARQAGLRPSTLGYPRTDFGNHELVQRNINFSVTGTYDQLRNFINFLELADHFVTLNSVTLGESGNDRRNPTLGINLVLSTIFTTRDPEDAEVADGLDAEGLDAEGLDAEGLDADGLDAEGLDADGLDAEGLDADGLDADGLDADGLDADGLGAVEPEV